MRIGGTRTAHMENVWARGEFIGRTAATARATIRPGNIRLTPTRDYGDFSSILFSHTQGLYGRETSMKPREIPNIKSVEWTRSIDQDVASCTIQIYNTFEDHNTGEIQGGYFTWNRGDNPFSKTHTQTSTPFVGGCSAFQRTTMTFGTTKKGPFGNTLSVTAIADQPFKKVDETGKVKQIRFTMPAGTSGTFKVGIKNDPQLDLEGKQVAIKNPKIVDTSVAVTLVPGVNVITLPTAMTLTQDHWYHFYIQSVSPNRTFSVTISDHGSTTKEFIDFKPADGDPGYSPNKTIIELGLEHILFEMIGPETKAIVGDHNEWYGWLVPDNIIQTFEGYGVNWAVAPEADENLLITGNWLIDDVDNDGSIITLKCRDFGRLLLEQIMFPPVVPRKSKIPGIQYPIYFFGKKKIAGVPKEQYTRVRTTFRNSSNAPYVGADGRVLGHYPHQAFDGKSSTHWLSVGNQRSNDGYSYEWIEANVAKSTIGAIEIRHFMGHYRAWVSVYANGKWVNAKGVIPYDPHNPVSAPNGSNIAAVASYTAGADNALQRITFTPVPNATRVRVTFTNLQNSQAGPYPFRAGVRDMVALSQKTVTTPDSWQPGNYNDYTDIVKLMLAWGGFHWPEGMPYVALSNGGVVTIAANPKRDPFLTTGRIWGDIEATGTWGPVTLPIDSFDKRPLMDGINSIREIIGFNFYIDETGGAIWRSPNWFERGNWIQGAIGSDGRGVRTQKMLRILDTQTLQDVKSTLSGKQVRERFYIATPDGRFVGGRRGYNLNPIGLRRVAGWIDQHFISNAECASMANLIAISAMMNYRTLNLTIAGIPTLQIDDQVEVVDHATGEGYVHYVRSISSKLDHSSGEYTYGVTTNWLGTRPGDKWMLERTKLSDGSYYNAMSDDIQQLIDFTDRGRKDGVYDQMGAVTLWASGNYSGYLDNGGS